METADRYVEGFATLVTVEQQLLNAGGSVRVAQLRLSGESPLRGEIQKLHRALEEAVILTRRTKRALLAEWRAAVEVGRAAA